MKKKLVSMILSVAMVAAMITGCGGSDAAEVAEEVVEEAAPVVEEAAEEAVEEVAEEATEEVAEAAEGVDDETWTTLQDTYASLTEIYDVVSEQYLNDDSIAQDDDVEGYLSAAKECLDQMAEIERDSLTNEDALELATTMEDLATSMSDVYDAITE